MNIYRVAAFTKGGMGGNPAGVVLRDSLPKAADMQRIAAEVGYSETAFAAPKVDGSWRVRYFSPESEVPFCGHATIALGTVLARTHGPGRYQLSLNHGNIEVDADERDEEWFSTLRSPPTHSREPEPGILAEALDLFGYTDSDLDSELPVRLAHGGADHLIVPLRTRAALAAMTYDLDRGRAFMRTHGIVTVAFVFRENERLFVARNAFASGGVLEDPATGAAAAAFAGMLRDLGVLQNGRIVILQGEDMGRSSQIEVTFTEEQGAPVEVSGTSAAIE